MNESVPVNVFYRGRSAFSVIALTGVAGSGCSSFARLLGDSDLLFRCSRDPKELIVPIPVETNVEKQRKIKDFDVDSSIGSYVRKRKYEICYNFLKENYQPYEIIKYTKLLWLYLLLFIKHRSDHLEGGIVSEQVAEVLRDKFKPSILRDKELKREVQYSPEKRAAEIQEIIAGFSKWDSLADGLNALGVDWIEKRFLSSESRESKKELASFFFHNDSFLSFVQYFTNELVARDYYSSCFYYHRFATQVRSCGDPFRSYDTWFKDDDPGCEYLFEIISIVILLLDGRREMGVHRRVVIDSIRNSMEALYLRERFSDFYLISIHDVNNMDHLKTKVANLYKPHKYSDEIVELYCKSVLRLNKGESGLRDFERGILSSPDTNRVIEQSEIHIQNVWGRPGASEEESFQYMAEQWIRYAALILHPGIITPTTSERCMAVAYTAKLNSGCLARQVGAAITNKDGSVRSIGWNEVPHGQVSCSLRTIDGILSDDPSARFAYSEFEMMGTEKYKDDKTFITKIKEDFGDDLPSCAAKLHGLPFSYCFRILHNRYEGERNQVFTRSLHAEENAIIQMSKYGGEALKDGVIYVTASPCELCSKKLYQIGVRRIVYIDPYPGIARQHIIAAGFKQPDLIIFEGAIGPTYFKLYQPLMPYKNEVGIMTGGKHRLNPPEKLLAAMLKALGETPKQSYTSEEIEDIVKRLENNSKGVV